MTEKRRVKVDFNELSAAFELNFPGSDAYLDLDTGAVVRVADTDRWLLEDLWEQVPDEGQNARDLLPALEALLAQRPDIPLWQRESVLNAARVELDYGSRYLSVDPEPYADYNDMQDFVYSLADGQLADQLAYAIRGRGAFGRFKGLLARHPRAQQAWYDFQARQTRQRLQDWLDAHGIEPVEPDTEVH